MVIKMNMTKERYESEMKKIQLKNEQIELKNKLKKEKNKLKKFKGKMKTSNKVLIASIIAIILFTVACMYIQYSTGIEVGSTLTTLWFSFWTVEIVALTGIKVSKVFKNYDQTSHSQYKDSDNCSDVVG